MGNTRNLAMDFEKTKKHLWEVRESKKVLIAAHSGTFGGVIIRNTIPAFENALKHGADIMEIDVIMSTDGQFYAFHNGNERFLFGISEDIRQLDSHTIENLQYVRDENALLTRIDKLSDVMDYLRGRCLINIDRSWFYWEEIITELQRYGMDDQIILKSPVDARLLRTLADSRSQFMYMPIVKSATDLDLTLQHDLRTIGAELIFSSLDSELITEEYLAGLKSKGIFSWVNAITLNDKIVLSGGLDDRLSVSQGQEKGWGRLLDMGFDIIQTDWPLLLEKYANIQ